MQAKYSRRAIEKSKSRQSTKHTHNARKKKKTEPCCAASTRPLQRSFLLCPQSNLTPTTPEPRIHDKRSQKHLAPDNGPAHTEAIISNKTKIYHSKRVCVWVLVRPASNSPLDQHFMRARLPTWSSPPGSHKSNSDSTFFRQRTTTSKHSSKYP
ncbi:unnamed protein product [Ectocarpus sp. 12 AP-2014]